MTKIDYHLRASDLTPKVHRVWEVSAPKIQSIDKAIGPGGGAPVFTVDGKYTARGWTEWTQGFQYGSAILQFDAMGDRAFLDLGRRKTVESMAGHVTHMGATVNYVAPIQPLSSTRSHAKGRVCPADPA